MEAVMDFINTWYGGLILMFVISAGAAYLIRWAKADVKRGRMLALATALALEAIPDVEREYPKGQSPGGWKKLREAVKKVQDGLMKSGYGVEVTTPEATKLLHGTVHQLHAGMSAYKNVQVDHLTRTGLINRPMDKAGDETTRVYGR